MLTAVANDYGYSSVFARQLRAIGTEADLAIGITTSGTSPSVCCGLREAGAVGMSRVMLTGPNVGQVGGLAETVMSVPHGDWAEMSICRIQEIHMVIIRTICEIVEESLTAADSDEK